MASVDFQKFKTATEVKNKIKHCDKTTRKNMNHSNKQIDVTKTHLNTQMHDSYNLTCEQYDKAIDVLDSQPGANTRKDRVTCFGLEIPVPENLSADKHDAWFDRVFEIIGNQYDAKNILNWYVHRDEVHEYAVADGRRVSRVHAHCFVIPEHDGKLNGKWFSKRTNMMKLNNAIHEMSEKEFHVKFMDGSKKKSGKTVQELKNESKVLELQSELTEKISNITQTAYDDEFLKFLENEHDESGKSYKDVFDDLEMRFKAHKTKKEEESTEELIESHSEPVIEPVEAFKRELPNIPQNAQNLAENGSNEVNFDELDRKSVKKPIKERFDYSKQSKPSAIPKVRNYADDERLALIQKSKKQVEQDADGMDISCWK